MNVFKVFTGFILVMLGLSLLAAQNIGSVEYGSVIIIGPIPIVLASSPGMAIFAVVFAVFLILFMLIMARW